MGGDADEYNPSKQNVNPGTDQANDSSSDDDMEDHIMLSERRMMLREMNNKRKRGMTNVAKVKNAKKTLLWLRTQCSLQKLHNLKRIITNRAMREAVEQMGFGSLLKVDNIRMPLKFLKHVVIRFDPYKCALYDHIGMKIDFDRIELGSMIGVPFNGIKVPDSIPDEQNYELRREFGLIGEDGAELKVTLTSMLERILEFTTPLDEFKRWFLAYVLTCFLCPTTVDHLSVLYIPAISVAANAGKYNWADYVLRWLRRFSRTFHEIRNKKHETPDGHGGCLAALLFLYLDTSFESCERGTPPITEEDVGLMCLWKKEFL